MLSDSECHSESEGEKDEYDEFQDWRTSDVKKIKI